MSDRHASLLFALALAFGAFCAGPAHARSSDRQQAMDIQAAHTSGTLDDRQPTILTGNVRINQGTLNINADRAVVTLRGSEPVRAVLTGSQAMLKQELDNGTPMTAKADRIDYDMVADVVVFTGNYTVTTQRGTTKGQRLTYNLQSGQLESGSQDSGGVQIHIPPKSARTQD